MRVTFAGQTDVGRKRTHNEDAFLLLPEEQLYCVADGMGGHASGEVASRIAVEEMAEFFRVTGRDDEATWPFKLDPALGPDENRLAVAVKLANLRIFERAQADARLKGMGTTLVAAHLVDGGRTLLVGHVGDSRAYLLRGGAAGQLTEDHSLLNDFLKTQVLSPEEIAAFPHKNVIVRALGMKEKVEVDLVRRPLEDGDAVLLCSDGLSSLVPPARLAELFRAHRGDLKAAADAMVAAANDAGGPDNVTCVLVQVAA